MKKLLFAAAFVVVAALAFVAGDQYGMNENENMGLSDSSPAAGTEKISASFRCDNDSSFIADFLPDMDHVTISSEREGNAFYKMSSASGKMYGNESWTFLFRDEEVTVNDLKAGTTTTCEQLPYAHNEPVNFGD